MMLVSFVYYFVEMLAVATIGIFQMRYYSAWQHIYGAWPLIDVDVAQSHCSVFVHIVGMYEVHIDIFDWEIGDIVRNIIHPAFVVFLEACDCGGKSSVFAADFNNASYWEGA